MVADPAPFSPPWSPPITKTTGHSNQSHKKHAPTPIRGSSRAQSTTDSHDAIRVEGNLLKLAKWGRKHWNDRYFVLSENELSYYGGEDTTSRKLKDHFLVTLGSCEISSLYMDQRQESALVGAGGTTKTKELLYCFRISLFEHQHTPSEAIPTDNSLTHPHTTIDSTSNNNDPRGIPLVSPPSVWSGTISPLHGPHGMCSAPQSFDTDDIIPTVQAHRHDAPISLPTSPTKKHSLFKRSKSVPHLRDNTNASISSSLPKHSSTTKWRRPHFRTETAPPPPLVLDGDEEARRLLMPRSTTGYVGTACPDNHRQSYFDQQQWQEQQLMHAHYLSEQKEHKKQTRKRIKEGGKLVMAAGAAVTVGVLTAGVGLMAGLLFLVAGAAASGTGVVGGAAYRQRRKKRGEIVLASPHYEEARRWKTALDACLVSETVVNDSTWGQLFVMDGRSAKTALLPTEITTTSHIGGSAELSFGMTGDISTRDGQVLHFSKMSKAAPFVEPCARWEPIQNGGWSTLLGTGTQGMRIFREERSASNLGRLSVKDDSACPPLKAQSVLCASPLQAFLCLMSVARVPSVVDDSSSIMRPNSGQCASFRIIERTDDHTDIIHLFFRSLYLFPSWTMPRDFVLFRYWRYEPDGSYVICFDSIEHIGCPHQAGYTRGDMHGVYTITPQKKRQVDSRERTNECLLTSIVQVDPRGWVPHTFLSTYAEAFGVFVLLQMFDIKDALDRERFVPVPCHAPTPALPWRHHNYHQHHTSIEKASSLVMDEDPCNYDFAYANHESPYHLQGKNISIGCEPPPLPRHKWAEPDANSFRVRGKTYKKDKIKINAGSSIGRLIAVDVVSVDEPIYSGVALHPTERIQLALARERRLLAKGLPSDVPPFVFLVNIVLPGPPFYHGLFYYAIDDMSSIDGTDGTPSSKLCQQFIFGDSDDFRDRTFKLIPTIVEGNFVVKKAVGSTPAIMGRKLRQSYVKHNRFFEVILDCGSSSVATGVIRLTLGYAKSLVVDLGFLFEGYDESTLPERILGCARMKYPEFGAVLRKVMPAVAPPNEAEEHKMYKKEHHKRHTASSV